MKNRYYFLAGALACVAGAIVFADTTIPEKFGVFAVVFLGLAGVDYARDEYKRMDK